MNLKCNSRRSYLNTSLRMEKLFLGDIYGNETFTKFKADSKSVDDSTASAGHKDAHFNPPGNDHSYC